MNIGKKPGISTKNVMIVLIFIIVATIAGRMVFSHVVVPKMMEKARSKPPIVETAVVVSELLNPQIKPTGRIEPKHSVEVVARINGWLDKRYFQEGAYVKKGQVLFQIEPREYAIAVQQAQASLRQANAAYINSQKELERANELVKSDFVSKSYYDKALATRDQSKANLDVCRANLAAAQLNYSYTNITSPINGKIGKIFITEGNLVNPQTGPLAKIVSMDPVYASFTLKSKDYLRFKKEGDADNALPNMSVQIKLADGSLYPGEGKIEFVNNEIDQTAGTITLRASFANPDNLLVPGDFVNFIIKSTAPKKVILVPQIAVSDSTSGFYVWVIDENGAAQIKPITIGEQEKDSWIVIDGLKEGDVVISKGLLRLKPGIKVEVAQVPAEQNSKTEEIKDKEQKD